MQVPPQAANTLARVADAANAVGGIAYYFSFFCFRLRSSDSGRPGVTGDATPRSPLRGYRATSRKINIMRTSAKLITALSVAALVGVAGSAFTATSTIDAGQKYVGATGQSVTGVHVSSVQYTTNATTDFTTAVSFHVAEDLGAETTITATISNAVPASASDACTPTALGAGLGTNLVCSFGAGLLNVDQLDIVAS
jgi:hypothetical protein